MDQDTAVFVFADSENTVRGMNNSSFFGTPRKIWISILFGILCFIFSPYGITVDIEETSIDIVLSIIFPIIASMAFGWRYGLIAGLAGGALFPFLLWANDGWANVLYSISFLFLISMFGLVNDTGVFKKLNTYHLRLIVFLIFYILFNWIITRVFFNPILALNPPFWNADAIKFLPLGLINKLIIKESVSIIIIILVSDTLLELSFFRKFMGLAPKPWTSSNNKVFLVVLLTVLLVFLITSGLYFVFVKGVHDFVRNQIALVYFGIITSGFLTSRILFYYNEINFNIQSQLEKTEEKFKSIFENINDAIFILKDGVIIDCNQKSLTVFGCSANNEIIGKTPAYLSPMYQSDGSLSDEKAFDYLNRIVKEHYLRFEWRHLRIDGSIFEAEVWLNKIEHATEIFVQAIVRDITERKKTEKQISMFAHAIRSVSECISITDMSDNIIFVNSSFLKTYQFDETELLGNSINMVRSPKNSPALTQEILPATLSGGWNGELLNKKKDGSEFPVFLSASVIKDEKGNPLALIGVTTDISERKRTENELVKSKQRLTRGESVSETGNWEYDPDSGIVDTSAGASEIYGVEESFFTLSQVRDLQLPEYREELIRALQNLIEKGEPYNVEYKIKKGVSGEVRNIRSIAEYDQKKRTVFGIIQDITNQKQIEQALRESEELFRKVTTLSGYLVFDHNPDTDSMNWSGAIEQVSGYTESEFGHKSYKKLIESIHEDDKEKAIYDFEEAFPKNNTLHSECRYKIKSGEYIWIEVLGFKLPFDNSAGYKVIGIVRDISHYKTIEEKILNGVIKAEEGERLHFSQELHDGLGPLISAIKMYVQLIPDPQSKMDKNVIVGKALELLTEASATLREISFRLSPHTLKNFGIVPALLSFIERIKDSNKIDIIFNYHNIERFGEITETIIYRIICECINNTIRHAQAHEILIEMNLKDEILDIIYVDDGIGFQVDQVLNKPKGVGLLNMQSRIKSINGHINIKSEPGSGTSIHVKFKF